MMSPLEEAYLKARRKILRFLALSAFLAFSPVVALGLISGWDAKLPPLFKIVWPIWAVTLLGVMQWYLRRHPLPSRTGAGDSK